MDSEVIEDLAKLEAQFEELNLWPSEFSITAAMWPVLSQRVRDALEADLTDLGYDWTKVRAVEYVDGQLYSVTVLTIRK